MRLVLVAITISFCVYLVILVLGLIARRWRPYGTRTQRGQARLLCLVSALLGAASIAVVQPIFGPRHVLSLVGVPQVPAGLITAIVFYLWVSAFPLKLLVTRDDRR
jgi:hypothetical protein